MKKFLILFFITAALAGAACAAENEGWLSGHMTTCTGLINDYPADSTNWFYRAQHKVVQYWAYFLIPYGKDLSTVKNKEYLFLNPYEFYAGSGRFKDESNFTFENKWISPSGKVICEKVMSWSRASSVKRVTVDDRDYVPYTFANYIGITQMIKENGQERLPDEQGLYHINLYINGELASVTFFEMKD